MMIHWYPSLINRSHISIHIRTWPVILQVNRWPSPRWHWIPIMTAIVLIMVHHIAITKFMRPIIPIHVIAWMCHWRRISILAMSRRRHPNWRWRTLGDHALVWWGYVAHLRRSWWRQSSLLRRQGESLRSLRSHRWRPHWWTFLHSEAVHQWHFWLSLHVRRNWA